MFVPDPGNLSAGERQLIGLYACFFYLGVSSVGMKEVDYRRITYDLTLGAATTLARLDPQMSSMYVSGAGPDSTKRVGNVIASPLLGLLARTAPRWFTTSEQVGRAMLVVARRGAPSPLVESIDINTLR